MVICYDRFIYFIFPYFSIATMDFLCSVAQPLQLKWVALLQPWHGLPQVFFQTGHCTPWCGLGDASWTLRAVTRKQPPWNAGHHGHHSQLWDGRCRIAAVIDEAGQHFQLFPCIDVLLCREALAAKGLETHESCPAAQCASNRTCFLNAWPQEGHVNRSGCDPHVRFRHNEMHTHGTVLSKK